MEALYLLRDAWNATLRRNLAVFGYLSFEFSARRSVRLTNNNDTMSNAHQLVTGLHDIDLNHIGETRDSRTVRDVKISSDGQRLHCSPSPHWPVIAMTSETDAHVSGVLHFDYVTSST